MRFISSKVHGALDYLSGLLLILSPWIFDFANGGFAQWIPILVGVTILLVSLFTDYELSLSKQIPLETHLGIDILGGAMLAASPWIFTFYDWVFWPHLLLGLAEIGAGLLTHKVPDYKSDLASDLPTDADSKKSSPKRGDVIELDKSSIDNRKQRHMSNEEEIEAHVQEKDRKRAADNTPYK